MEAFYLLAGFSELFVIETGLDRSEASMAPTRSGHDGNEFKFQGSFGLELVDVGVEEVLVVVFGFAGEDDLLGRESVLAGVEGDLGFAGGEVGPVDFWALARLALVWAMLMRGG